ncbi:BON domain-containing protein [Pseudomonas sp. GD03842]|uniref:BON domain-containing protein n=1 Tax=unclassified Pseudomonas TaxID=196821 RepID=UPI000D37DBE4|nr:MULTISPECIES: BON domain-containing protein [unclassified Pseudomonas]MDH0747207.1 BON domain-containing protein [Pseudomonas sp. GD03842]RAU42271.1 BON domain-containing protein [Pseudomonas sp. RIT 409]RAU55080.1 BON domain-containing protein [Pseudomonas sp. RIT 412]
MSDLELRRMILDELEFQPNIDAAAIGVAIENGVVSLTGHVRTYAQKFAAERAVKSVKGVKAVAEEIKVVSNEDLDISDEAIAGRCLDVIRWNSAIPDERLQIKVQNGWVTLEGEVDWQYQKEAAQSAVRKLAGVVGINNMLILKPKETPENIKERIEAAFARNAALDSRKLRVTVEGKTVKLEGHVHQWLERKAAENAAWSIPGVTHVENYILIA